VPAYTVTLRTSGPGSTQGLVHLHARDTGALLAVLDAGHLSALATGVVGALGAEVLARPDASRVALLGASPQASRQIKSLRLVRSLQHARVYDPRPERSVDFAARAYKELNLPVRPALSVEEAVEDADVVLVTDAPGAPVLFPGMLRAGTHVTALAAEGLGTSGLAPGLLRQSAFYCDAATGLPGEDLRPTELGEVIAGTRPGRTDAGQITVCAVLGPPWQDLVAAWHVYLGARGDEDARRLDFES
jgi:alanine dehydrogenase